jgi:hypothetical protein
MPPDSRWCPKDRVMVIEGVCRGDVGIIKGPSKYTYDGEQIWLVQLDGYTYESTIRESFLVPEPAKSDEDVLGPLRNTVPG